MILIFGPSMAYVSQVLAYRKCWVFEKHNHMHIFHHITCATSWSKVPDYWFRKQCQYCPLCLWFRSHFFWLLV